MKRLSASANAAGRGTADRYSPPLESTKPGEISRQQLKEGDFLKRKENIFTKPFKSYHKSTYTCEQMKQEFTKKKNDT